LVATEPVSTLRKNRQRATCQPPRFPAPAARQLCDANLVGWAPMISAISRIVSAVDAADVLGRSGVYSAYSSSSACSSDSNSHGRSGRVSRR
jgi:hypothetical protein